MKEIAIYGVGECGKYVWESIINCEKSQYCVVLWIDNYVKGFIEGIPVITEEAFLKEPKVELVIIAVTNKSLLQDLTVSLLNGGYGGVFLVHSCCVVSKLPIVNSDGELSRFVWKWNEKKPDLLYCEFQVADHCNLKCKACAHYSNTIVENIFADLLIFEADLKKLSLKFSNIEKFRLMGGEPLLNPELPIFIQLVRKYFPISDIRIVTNGLLLRSISKSFIETIHDCQATIDLSQYPPVETIIEEIVDFMDKNKIKYMIEPPAKKFFVRLSEGEEDAVEIFNRYCLSRGCRFLRNGKIFVCPHIPLTYETREFLSLNISYDEYVECSIDLSDSLDGWGILQRFAKPFSMCRFCAKDVRWIDWKHGKEYRKDDWIAKED